MTSPVFANLKNKLLAASKSANATGLVSKLAYDFEDAYLDNAMIPDAAFALFVDLFSDARLRMLPGLSSFIAVFFTDFDKLSEDQRNQLLEVFAAGATHYSDEMTRHAIGDLIARKYPLEQALACFEGMMLAASPNATQVALTGADILMKRVPSTSPIYSQIDAIWTEAQQR